MNINNLSFPHPVLGVGDDISGKYDVDCEKEIFVDRVILKIDHKLDNTSLFEMINKNSAIYGVEIKCLQTVYRQMFFSKNVQQEIIINADDLRGKVEINFFVVALGKTQKYRPSAVNGEYGNAVFTVSSGEVLGYGGSTYFNADKRWKESESVSSFMSIIKSKEKKDGPIEYFLMNDRIIISLPENDYDNYKKAGSDFKKIFNVYHGALVYPALFYALTKIFDNKETDEILKTYSWYEQLSDRLDSDSRFKNIEKTSENASLIAQTLLSSEEDGMPISRTLKCVRDIIEATFINND